MANWEATTTSDQEGNWADGNWKEEEEETSPSAPPVGADEENAVSANSTTDASPRHGVNCYTVMIIVASILFLILFFFATLSNVVEDAGSRAMWIVFYALHVILPALFLIKNFFRFSTRALLVLAGGMAVWSMILMIVSAVRASKAGDDSDEDATFEWIDEKNEHRLEAVGSGFGMVSALFHFSVVRCLYKQKSNEY